MLGHHKHSKGYWIATRKFEEENVPMSRKMAKQVLSECDEFDEILLRIRAAAEAATPPTKPSPTSG